MFRHVWCVARALSLLLAVAGCGGGNSPTGGPAGPAATGSPQPGQKTLAVVKVGTGTVRSTPPGIDCGGACSATFDAGTNISLLAVADAGWSLAGWTGACSGTGACSVTLGSDSAVSATFQAVAPRLGPSHRLDVARSGDGKGRVTSNPGGIDCSTACGATFPDGSVVTLTATPEPGSKFGGWGGACSGNGACTLTISGDTAAIAPFSLQPAPDECAGLRPLAPGAAPHSRSQARQTSTGDDFCEAGVGDGTGALALFLWSRHAAYIDFVGPSGDLRSHTSSQALMFTDQLAGFISLDYAGAGPRDLTAWDSSGRQTAFRPYYDYQGVPGFRGSEITQDPSGGVVGNSGQSYDEGLHPRWDAAINQNCAGCPGTVPAGVDRAGRALFFFDDTSRFGANSLAAKWVDHDGKAGAVFQWFGPRPGHSGFLIAPRVGDGFFIASGGRWTDQIDSLATVNTPAPAWLQARPNTSLHMVHGGRGYAVLPAPGSDSPTCSQTVEVFAPSGTSCGTAIFAAGTGPCTMKAITVGYEGTVIQQLPDSKEQQLWFGPSTCTWQWWPGFFG